MSENDQNNAEQNVNVEGDAKVEAPAAAQPEAGTTTSENEEAGKDGE